MLRFVRIVKSSRYYPRVQRLSIVFRGDFIARCDHSSTLPIGICVEICFVYE